MKKNIGHISLVSFENHKLPEFKEVRNKDWVYYGEDNMYPDYLIKLFTRNSFNNAIITGKSTFVFGKGLEGDEKFLKMANPSESWNEITIKAITDYELFNGFAYEVIWANGKPVEFYHLDYSKVRSNSDGTEYYFCDNWFQYKPQDDPSFRIMKPYTSTGKGSQIFYYRQYRPNISSSSDVYPLPDYVGCIADIETDIEITNFHYNNTKHGFSAGTMVNFNNGMPPQEKIIEIEKKFKSKFSGTDKSGNIILTFNDSKDKEATVISLQPNNLDKQFEQLSDRLQQNIFTGHKITTPMLFGIKTTGQLGGRSEMVDGWELFKNTYINSRRHVIEKTVNEFAKYYGVTDIKIKEHVPVGLQLSESTLASKLTDDEIRALAGYEPKKIEEPQIVKNVMLSKEDDRRLIEAFKKVGTSEDEFVVIREKKFCFHSEDEMKQFFASPLTVEVSKLDQQVLSILAKEPLTSLKDIAKALKVKVSEVSDAINTLTDKGYIKTKNVVINDEPSVSRELTKSGNEITNEIPQKTLDISLVYQYKVMAGLGDNIIPTTREFCREIIGMKKKFTRSEIQQVSNEVGYSVFMDRGGFYHNPKTGVTTPYCRHEWVQQVVKKIS